MNVQVAGMTDLQFLLRRKKRTGDWNVGDNTMATQPELEAASNRIQQLTGAGFCYARALDTAAQEYNISAEDIEKYEELNKQGEDNDN